MEREEKWNVNQDQSGSFCKPQKCAHGILIPWTLTKQILVVWKTQNKWCNVSKWGQTEPWCNDYAFSKRSTKYFLSVFVVVVLKQMEKRPFLKRVVLVQLRLVVESYFFFSVHEQQKNTFCLYVVVSFLQNWYGKNGTTTRTFDCFWHLTLQREATWPSRKQHRGSGRVHGYR